MGFPKRIAVAKVPVQDMSGLRPGPSWQTLGRVPTDIKHMKSMKRKAAINNKIYDQAVISKGMTNLCLFMFAL